MSHLATLFTTLAWWTLKPDEELLPAQPGHANPTKQVSASRSAGGDLAVIYLPRGGPITPALNRLPAVTNFRWFNPRTGEYTEAATASTNPFIAPTTEDWVWVGTASPT
jgi:hypothetical protein